MSKHQIQFKDPDLIFELINAKHPLPDDEEDITPRLERLREDYSSKFFEYGDYGRIEIDSETLACRLLPRKEWR
jgi:hypothetical protein